MAKTTRIDFSNQNFTICSDKLGRQVKSIGYATSEIYNAKLADGRSAFPDENVSATLSALYNSLQSKYEDNVDKQIHMGRKRTNISNIESSNTAVLTEKNGEISDFSTIVKFLFGDLINVSGDDATNIPQVAINCMRKDEYMNYTDEELLIFDKALRTEATMLSIEEKEILIAAYERQFPEYGANMDKVLTKFRDDNLDMHILNIKVLAYTANEPYRTLYLKNVGEVEIQELHETGQQRFKPGIYENGGGVYVNVDEIYITDIVTGEAHASEYNVFFHETSHAIDYSIGIKKNWGNSYTRIYTDASGISLSQTLEAEVRKRLDESVNKYLDSVLGLPWEMRDEISESVKDAILNQIDYKTYDKPDFINEHSGISSACYNAVLDDLNSQIPGTAGDIYGAFTGNTLKGNFVTRIHPSIEIDKVIQDESGNTEYEYDFYWLDKTDGSPAQPDNAIFTVETDNGDIFTETKELDEPTLRDGDNLAEKIIYSDGNLVYNTSSGNEFFAETMAANMTRENGNERKVLEFYYDETMEYFNEMVSVMLRE